MVAFSRTSIEEKNPLKQGLKHYYDKGFMPHNVDWREESIKTRIETLTANYLALPKCNWREESIKTRIETRRRIESYFGDSKLKRRIH